MVALLAEGVDRNIASFGSVEWAKKSPSSRRAWIEMLLLHVLLWFWLTSPSSRRAWIEITPAVAKKARRGVALLAEGVDRNLMSFHTVCRARWSPSSRRAWIEIKNCLLPVVVKIVALLAEGVDRNQKLFTASSCKNVALLAEGVDRNRRRAAGRRPRPWSPSSRRAWIEICYT